MNQHTPKSEYWVYLNSESTPRNVTPLSKGAALWYADTLATEFGIRVRVFRHGERATIGRLIYSADPKGE